MGCEHNLLKGSETLAFLNRKLREIFGESNSLCPICVIRELAKSKDEIGIRAKKVYNAYDELKKANDKFINVLDNSYDSKANVEITRGPIDFLELDGEKKKDDDGRREDDLPF